MTTKKRLSGPEARQRILQAAARAFRQHGMGTTVDQIAEEAQYSTSALYKHFENREAILNALSHDLHTHILAIYASQDTTQPFEAQLRSLIGNLVSFAQTQVDYFTAVLSTTPRIRVNQATPDYERHVTHINELARMMALGQAEGRLTQDLTPHELAEMLRALLDATGAAWARSGEGELLRKVDRTLDFFLLGATPPS